jgi:hypothetical protein
MSVKCLFDSTFNLVRQRNEFLEPTDTLSAERRKLYSAKRAERCVGIAEPCAAEAERSSP